MIHPRARSQSSGSSAAPASRFACSTSETDHRRRSCNIIVAMLPTSDQVEFWLFTLLCSGLGAYGGAYLKKRAENLATRDELDKLIEQMKATTEATKAIESRIDDQVWNKQRQWELKREALLGGAWAVNDFMVAVMKVNAAFAIEERQGDIAFGTQLANHQTEAMTILNKASYDFQRAQVLVSVVSGIETQTAFVSMEEILKRISSQVVDGNTTIFKELMPLVMTAATAITNAIRKDLGVEVEGLNPMPQSNVSSATPIPD